MNNRILYLGTLAIVALTLVACGGGGGGGSAPPIPAPIVSPSVAPTNGPVAGSVPMGGTVRSLSSDGYGPAVVANVTYQGGTLGAPLANATVVIGTTPIVGATPPAALPAGDVSTTTNASGQFSVTVPFAVVSSAVAFNQPQITTFYSALPTSGFYVEVFPQGVDGLSAGVALPVHAFVAPSITLAFQSTSPTSAEAGALVALNNDRAANNAGPLVFDEYAEEAARMHVTDMATNNYGCHYDRNNAGPASRYLAFGSTEKTAESIAGLTGTSPSSGFASAEAAFMAEKSSNPQGGHYLNNVNPLHNWAGLAVAQVMSGGAPVAGAYDIDYELISPNADSSFGISGYTNAGCTSTGKSIVVNQS